MATQIFLGNPPENIKKWIEEHVQTGPKLDEPLTFTAHEPNSTVKFIQAQDFVEQPDGSWQPQIYGLYDYSYDGISWHSYTSETLITLNNIDDKVMFRATDKNESCYAINGACASQFITTGKIAISGNIMTLLDKTGQQTTVPKYGLGYLFGGSTLSSTDNDAIISGPFFPSSITDIYNKDDWCHSYQEIFASCPSLKSLSFPNITINDVKTIITNSKMFGFDGIVRNEPIEIECKDGIFYYNYEEN